MVLITIKFIIVINKWSNKKKEYNCEFKTEKFVNNSKICINKQVSYIKRDLNI